MAGLRMSLEEYHQLRRERAVNERPEHVQKFFGAFSTTRGNWDNRREVRALSVPRLLVRGEKDLIPVAGSRE